MPSPESTTPTDNSLAQLPTGDGHEAVHARVVALKKLTDQCLIQLARELWTVYHRQLYIKLGHETFADYARAIGYSKDKADRMRRLFSTLVLKFNLRPSQLKGISYTNALAVIPIMRQDKDQALEWVERAKSFSYVQLLQAIEERERELNPPRPLPSPPPGQPLVTIPGNGKTPRPFTSSDLKARSFRISDEQDTLLEEALAEAQRVTRSDADGFNLSMICQEFLSSRTTKTGKRDGRLMYHLRQAEEMYGVRILVLRDDSAWDALKAAVESCPDILTTEGDL